MTKQEIINLYTNLSDKLSLDQKLLQIYKQCKTKQSFEATKVKILKALNIDELQYYFKNIDKNLMLYIEANIFPQYSLNDQGHGILHIKEVIRRSFALNETFNLKLNENMLYAIAACHDLGKYIDHATHEKIAAKKFIENTEFKKFFSNDERKIISEAIEDHRSSKEDEPRSVYGKLISSADRNTTIQIVFIRSFYVALERMPNENINDYLDFTLKRLRKKYDEQNPENMFYEDEIYKAFLVDMRKLLAKPTQFKNQYCKINNITNRYITVSEAHKLRGY